MRTCLAVIHKEGDLYVAQCPELGTTSQGGTIEAAVDSLREATELYIEEFPAPASPRCYVTTFDVDGGG